MILYHGSNFQIERIDLAKCNPYKDFGQAFYLTSEKGQALDIALARVDIFGGKPVINAFIFKKPPLYCRYGKKQIFDLPVYYTVFALF